MAVAVWRARPQSGVEEAFVCAGAMRDDPLRATAKAAVKAALLDRPSLLPRIGRYTLVGPVGRGGMGVVLAARDRELDRTVAIKLVVPSDDADCEREEARLLREGQALARLNHPNVIAIFDAGLHELHGRPCVWLAMELVPGRTLRGWLFEAKPERAAILAVMLAAARGLAAAHAAGLVHRDVKPDNVLVADDGRPRVLDFGLAKAADDPTARTGEASGTRAGTTAGGTLGYAAPEQRRGEPASPAADQFAFCVTLHEALVGRRLGAGERADRSLPRWIARAIERGCSEDPRQRHASMDALVRALVRPRRRGVALAATGALALAFGAALVPGEGRDAAVIADLATMPAGIEARMLLEQARHASDAHAFAQAEPLAEAARGAAATARDAALELDATLLLVHVVGWGQGRNADAARLVRSVDAIVHRLGDDPQRRSEALAVRASVEHGEGRYDEAIASYREALALRELAGGPTGPLWQALGVSLYRIGALEHAIAAQGHAHAALVRSRGADDPDVAAVLVSRAQAKKQLGRLDDARADYRAAIDLLQRHHGAEHRALAIPLLNYGNLERVAGDMPEAARLHARYRAIVAEAFPADHHEHGRALVTLAEEKILARDFDAAVTAASKAVDIAERSFGDAHVRVAYALGIEGQALLQRGDARAALDRLQGSVAAAEKALGKDDPQLAYYILSRCDAELATGDRDAARAGYERARAMLDATPEAEAPIRAHLDDVASKLAQN